MSEPTQASEIAREALRRLAARRIQPTPENYRSLYHEIAGTHAAESFPDKPLKALAAALPRDTAEQNRFARQIEAAVAARSWAGIRSALGSVLAPEQAATRAWGSLIHDLLRQLERRHAGVTPAKKRESLEHVLAASGSDANVLHDRLSGLVRSWLQAPQANNEPLAESAPPAADAPQTKSAPDIRMSAVPWTEKQDAAPASADLREIAVILLESNINTLLNDAPELAQQAEELAAEVRAAHSAAALTGFVAKLKKFTFRLQWVAEDQAELKAALLNVLRLTIQNIDELVVDDQWLQGQIGMVSDLFEQPLSLRNLDDVERRLKDLIYKQSALKRSLIEAQDRIKAMLSGFVGHLATFTESTSDYHSKIEDCAIRISSARDINELSEVVEDVLRETRSIQLSAERSRDDVQAMKARADDAEREIARLQRELEQTSQLIRHDQLTGVLNRKGLEEAFAREAARAHRRGAPLCLALLDVNNFKRLNDSLGHQAGDEALIHLARVTRETLRAPDTVARYGGEEFLILLPETDLPAAKIALTRLQRELTRRIFLHKNEKVFITFSAGVTLIGAQDERDQAIARADAAMYEAKRSGKNRVVAAP